LLRSLGVLGAVSAGLLFCIDSDEPAEEIVTVAESNQSNEARPATPSFLTIRALRWSFGKRTSSIADALSGQTLIGVDAIHDELGLGEKLRRKAHKIAQDLEQSSRNQVHRILPAGRAARRESNIHDQYAELRDQLVTLNDEATDRFIALLTPAQAQRFAEIRTQGEGFLALGRTEVADHLDLSDAQRCQVNSILEESRTSLATDHTEFSERAFLVLTPEQRKQFVSLGGKTFAFPETLQSSHGHGISHRSSHAPMRGTG
jgi:Spy/CpxP family protein refolding chaperone